jgi:hypothetical protein
MSDKDFIQLVEFVDNEYIEPSKEEIGRMFRELEKLIDNEGNTDDKNSHT